MRIGHIVPVLVKRYLNPAVRKRTTFLKGKSGIGKSDVVFQASKLLSEHITDWKGVIDLRLAQMEPTDLRGVPFIKDGRTTWPRPDFLPAEGAGILFLDEISSAPPATQAAAYQLCLTPADFGIPPEWMVVAAGNSKSDRGVTFNIAAPLMNRMCEYTVETTIDDFLEFGAQRGLRPEVLAFVRERGDMLHKFEAGSEIRPFPSPRSWFAVSDSLDMELPPSDRLETIRGDVGDEAATAFEAHLRYFEAMPRIDDILAGKDLPVPKDMSVVYCVAMGLAMRLDTKNADAAYKFIEKLPGEVQTLLFKLTFKRDRSIAQTAAFTKFTAKNANAFKVMRVN